MGPQGETFDEFEQRVAAFLQQLDGIPDRAVLFTHGIWISMLVWKLLGFAAQDGPGMRAFRQFQLGLPMPNCAVYRLREVVPGIWRVQADETIMRKLAAVQIA